MDTLNHDSASVGRWKREHAALQQRLETTNTFRGFSASGAPLSVPIALRRGERLFLAIDHAALVEPGPAAVDDAPATDHGVVSITDRRVVFTGALRSREWSFGRLVEHRHYERRPSSMIEVTNRKQISGFAYDTAKASDVRFLFDLALAHYDGTVDELRSGIEHQIIRHDALRPSVHAGAWVWRGWARPVPVASAVLAVLAVAGAFLSSSSDDSVRATALRARGTAPAFAPLDGHVPTGAATEPEPGSVVDRTGGGGPADAIPAAPQPAPTSCSSVSVLGITSVGDPVCGVLGT